MGFFDRSVGGITELRVHGVSGTPPESMLGHPHLQRIAGDGTTGFYRRLWEAESTSADRDGRRLEAYSWGGLTSGGWSRALWLLLIPFMLLNVAFFMTPFPWVADDGEGSERRRRIGAEALQRLLALALTVTLTLAAIGVFLDLLAWQCAGGQRCASPTWPLGLLVAPGVELPSQRLALGAMGVLLVIGLLALLGRSTWRANETVNPPDPHGQDPDSWRSPLESRDFWRGGTPVKRLRWLHVAAAMAVLTVLTMAPLASADLGDAVRLQSAPDVLAVLGLLVVAGCAVCVLQPSLSERVRTSRAAGDEPADVRRPEWWLLVAAGLLVIVSDVVAWTAPSLGLAQPTWQAPEILPWFTAASTIAFVAEAAVLTAFGLLVLASATRRRSRTELPWRGLGSVAFALIAWAFAGSFAVALQLWVAGGLGNPAPEGVPGAVANPLLIPLPYFWGGVALLGALVALAVALLVALAAAWRIRGRLLEPVTERERRAAGAIHLAALYPAELGGAASPPQEVRDRERRIAWRLALGQATDQAVHVMGWLVCAASVIVVAAAVLDLLDGRWITGPGQGLLAVGSWVLALAAASFFTLAYRAYDTPALRRTVGILWDLGTFWPRATHPLAPPCYTERAVPELLHRTEFLLDGSPEVPPRPEPPATVVLSCHSQGTVIGAAVVSTSTYAVLDRIALLTYGCPLRRLYSGFFPTYFGPKALERLGELLAGSSTERHRWPWLNLYRVSDPIGSWVFGAVEACEPLADAVTPSPREVDWQFVDPRFGRPPGDLAYPPVLAHSDYWLD
ncbi:MAG TPA: hypothetical protein VEV65_01765, partial [Kineosporiaceae bacterium]|nr:hypothetical protein [Kineosporiaceae bacterium]